MKKRLLYITIGSIVLLCALTLIIIISENNKSEENYDTPVVPKATKLQEITSLPSPISTTMKTISPTSPSIPTLTSYKMDEANPDYRQAMRHWVIRIHEIAKDLNEGFMLIPQNCAPLFTDTGEVDGIIAENFLRSIDGIGVEGISYGNNKFNIARRDRSKEELIDQLDLGVDNGIVVLAVDYCSTNRKIDNAIQLNEEHMYISYIADSLELTKIPISQISTNDMDIQTLDQAENWLYLLNPEEFKSKERFVSQLAATDYDVLVIDSFYSTEEMLDNDDLQRLKIKANGGTRLVISYLSIGEAEDYRYYWSKEYDNNPPRWVLTENSKWEGNYPVKYWEEEWQEIIATGDNSYLKRIISAGFDGVYLDIVDGYETFEDMD